MQSVINTEKPFFIGAPDTHITRFSVFLSGYMLFHLEGISIIDEL